MIQELNEEWVSVDNKVNENSIVEGMQVRAGGRTREDCVVKIGKCLVTQSSILPVRIFQSYIVVVSKHDSENCCKGTAVLTL